MISTRKKTLEEFIADARKVHGNKYDYSRVVYIDSRTPVQIVCLKHGVFQKSPSNHLKGQGCKKCSHEKLSKERVGKPIKKARTLVKGVGIFDSDLATTNEKVLMANRVWRSMLSRCYSKKYQEKEPSYIDCSVCEEWLLFSNFKKWFDENYVDGYALDKDILIKGNKVYSPDTCCFVPFEINALLIKSNRKRGLYPIGVCKCENRFRAYLSVSCSRLFLGSFVTIEEAFTAYKQAKEAYIKEVAQRNYDKGEITERVYDALMRYEVEITD